MGCQVVVPVLIDRDGRWLFYGGKTAMRMPTVLPGYCLSIWLRGLQ